MFSRWDLKYLKDPKKVFGETEFIGSVARKGLKKDKPEVYKILDNFYWELDDCQQVMLWSKDTSSEEAARKRVDENQDKVVRWIK
jgi:glycine betaine/proline transport system substrate-binding protein